MSLLPDMLGSDNVTWGVAMSRGIHHYASSARIRRAAYSVVMAPSGHSTLRTSPASETSASIMTPASFSLVSYVEYTMVPME